ncbi:autotransporter outer membrane beta-barrel domain-containing protein [Desulfoluna butyratoxydans]|uniref:autotransporter outer membrane beta-barrel domain-containing protein n=1 Tax=Desulfoluna butyratoxydans TaxID=231438 RepID=UPI0015D1EC47|nr:autotransporter outer membrane beta-barrel domain-containing protein [Desulfoluna butyratoxydans]
MSALHGAYFGRVFIHDEDIAVEKKGVPLFGARTSEGVVYASGICVGGDDLLVENNASVTLRAQYPAMEDVGRVDSVAKAFGLSVLNGGIALNEGRIDAGASGESVRLSTDGRHADVGANLVVLSCGIWATRSGQLAFSIPAADPGEGASVCLALNRGDIAVSSGLGDLAAGPDATYRTRGRAYGMYCDTRAVGVNTGRISATATGGMRLHSNTSPMETDVVSCGMYGEAGSMMLNTGSVVSFVSGERLDDPGALGTPSASGTVRSQAMGLFGDKGAAVVNTGEVSVTARGGDTGDNPEALAYGLMGSTGSRIVNTGSISVFSQSRGKARSYGIVSTGDADLYSTGMVDARAASDSGDARAYAVYAADGRLVVKEYEVLFSEDTSVLNGVWGHSATGSFDLSDAALHVRIDESTLFETPYQIDGAVSGETHRFSRVEGLFSEDIAVVGLNGNESILFRYAPAFNPAIKSFRQTLEVMNQGIAMADEAFMAAGMGQGTRKRGDGPRARTLFVMPYASKGHGDGYDAKDGGLCGGGTRAWGRDTLAGVHFVLDRGSLDFDPARYQDRETRMTHAALGVQGLRRITANTSLRLSSTFFYSTHDFEDKAPENQEEGDYKTQGVITRLAGTYVFRPAPGSVLAPEIGLRHEWAHQDAFVMDHMSWMGTRYGVLDEQELFVETAINWRGLLEAGDIAIEPRLRLFAEQVLTGGKVTGTMALADQQATLSDRQDNSAFGAQFSAEMTWGDTSLALGYSGRINDEMTRHRGWVNFQVAF